MHEIFEIGARIATPLTLAGFFGAVLFCILHFIITSRLIPAVRHFEAAPLLLHIVNKLFVLCLIAMILGFIGYISRSPIQPSQDQPTSPSPSKSLTTEKTIATPTPSDKTVFASPVTLGEVPRVSSAPSQPQFSPITLDEVLQASSDLSRTDLQKKEFRRRYDGKVVEWQALVGSVQRQGSRDDSDFLVVLRSPDTKSPGLGEFFGQFQRQHARPPC
jgi:hypothetical protein